MARKSETDDVGDEEWLYRRVFRDKFRTGRTPYISPNAFEPRTKGRDLDVDGISLYRADCLDDPGEVLAPVAQDRRGDQGIVRVSVSLLKSLGLSVRRSPDDQVRGHVVIPELNSTDYEADKLRFTHIKDDLAIEASMQQNILVEPVSR